MPDAEEPQPPARVEESRASEPTPLEDEEYNTRADEYMDIVHEKAEEIQEGREDVEVEYSVCLSVPSEVITFSNQNIRPAYSRSIFHQQVHTSSTSNRRTNKSGCLRQHRARSGSTGL